MKSVDAWFDNFDDFVRSFPPSAEFTGVHLLSDLENFAYDKVTEFKGSGQDLFVVVTLYLMLIVLDS